MSAIACKLQNLWYNRNTRLRMDSDIGLHAKIDKIHTNSDGPRILHFTVI